jgi:superfamily II DNA or RNA helicase
LTEELSRLLLIKRAAILKSAEGKMAAIEHVLTDHTLQRALVYVASIEEASAVSRILSRSGIKSARYSSIDQERRRILYDFSRGNLDALVSINCLDEGVDIPNAKIAVLASSDASERQFIQRRGRVLRTSPGKSHATIVDFIVLPPDLDKPVDIFQSEISRVSEFARYSRNPDTVLATLGRLLEPYGFSLSEVMVELGR